MSILSNLVRKISLPVAQVASFIPNPIGQGVALGAGVIAQDTARRDFKRAQEQERRRNMERFIQPSSISTIQQNLAATTPRVSTESSGGGFLSTVRGGLREVGGLVSDVFTSGIPQLLGYQRPRGVGQQPALTTVTNIGAQESQGSGSIQAGAGSLLAPVLSGARSLLKSPQGQLALGGGAGLVASFLGGDGKQMRITRKMKSQARMVLNMTGGNLSAAADILGIDENTLVMILLKRFRNDGPVVTKAALRKTKQTVRRLKSMCDMYDSLRPSATRRRTPMKRASTTTLIKN
jgi:hypothetical protein